jgi:hypothetical protein
MEVVVAVEMYVEVDVDVRVFAPPMATKTLAEISTPAMTIAAAMTR